MRKLVTSPGQVASNIRRFSEEIADSPEMQSRLGLVHDWYALSLPNGSWAFAPSKFAGYRDNSIKRYLETYQEGPIGSEKALEPLSAAVAPGGRTERELTAALEEFLDRWGRKPRRGCQIRTISEDEPVIALTPKRSNDQTLLARISFDPRICGGRPCIKGTRMRVVDIVEALAHGATADQLLRDFDYLTADDIAAALLYSARASDHRVVHTA
jgi:uncharacterized protein (DUF433 family)